MDVVVCGILHGAVTPWCRVRCPSIGCTPVWKMGLRVAGDHVEGGRKRPNCARPFLPSFLTMATINSRPFPNTAARSAVYTTLGSTGRARTLAWGCSVCFCGTISCGLKDWFELSLSLSRLSCSRWLKLFFCLFLVWSWREREERKSYCIATRDGRECEARRGR